MERKTYEFSEKFTPQVTHPACFSYHLRRTFDELFRAVAVVIRKRAAHARGGHSLENGARDDFASLDLKFSNLALEIRV